MKKLLLMLMFALVAATAYVPPQGSLGKHKKASPAQKYAEDRKRTTMRAWGFRTGAPYMNLEAYAAMVARGKLAEQTAVLITSTLKAQMDISNGSLGEIKAFTEELIVGSRVVKSDRYVNKDNTETCYVAVEISLEDILRNIQGSKEFQQTMNRVAGGRTVNVSSKEFADQMRDTFDNCRDNDQFLDTSIL